MLEIICTSIEDAVAAERGGADRIELISRFDLGGLTPVLALIEAVASAISIPVRAMVREIEDFYVTCAQDREAVITRVRQIAQLPVDGIVCGFLSPKGIDQNLLQEVLAAAQPLKATFHRAFETLDNPLGAIQELKRYPQIDRILTSGGTSPNRIAVLDACAREAAPEIQILAGGGMTESLLLELLEKTKVREYHFGTAVREGKRIDGKVLPEQVSRLRQLLNR